MTFAVSSQLVLSRAPEGPLAGYFASFANSLGALGYATGSIRRQVLIGACFSRWLGQRAVTPEGITSGHVTRYLRYRARRRRPCLGDRAALTHLMDFLRREGVSPAEQAVHERSSIDRCADAYEVYLREGRALATATIVNYVPFVRDFLRHCFRAKPVELSCLSASEVLRFVRQQAPRLHRKRAKLMTTALRSFLRYARYIGEVDLDLAAAVPVVANWSMTTIPRAITPDQVRQLLASIDRRNGTGRRDYAILLLLARLGLRSGEVALLTLDDVDWEAGQLTVHGKSGRRNELPLPADVGEAIAAYLQDGRPRSASRFVFLRAKAPVRGFRGACGIGSIIRRSLQRCGVDTPSLGAHQFRHGLATEMLRQGASLGEIGDVLGHRHPQTTTIYTKVDIEALRSLALPWPGSTP
ncbi:site-specific integrase [Variovorax sp. J22R133]|uniref:site-specific integrase n=1 Tax=Variovorax brevis TaxID=3053503 RepID=UPI0025765EF4|nr:site-specific integrase [Variovorax sp. J22R133]MDM0117504.1 site-specific integrase [Variovorax sp. J22R133]